MLNTDKHMEQLNAIILYVSAHGLCGNGISWFCLSNNLPLPTSYLIIFWIIPFDYITTQVPLLARQHIFWHGGLHTTVYCSLLRHFRNILYTAVCSSVFERPGRISEYKTLTITGNNIPFSGALFRNVISVYCTEIWIEASWWERHAVL